MKMVGSRGEGTYILFVIPTQNRVAIEELIGVIQMTTVVIKSDLQLEWLR